MDENNQETASQSDKDSVRSSRSTRSKRSSKRTSSRKSKRPSNHSQHSSGSNGKRSLPPGLVSEDELLHDMEDRNGLDTEQLAAEFMVMEMEKTKRAEDKERYKDEMAATLPTVKSGYEFNTDDGVRKPKLKSTLGRIPPELPERPKKSNSITSGGIANSISNKVSSVRLSVKKLIQNAPLLSAKDTSKDEIGEIQGEDLTPNHQRSVTEPSVHFGGIRQKIASVGSNRPTSMRRPVLSFTNDGTTNNGEHARSLSSVTRSSLKLLFNPVKFRDPAAFEDRTFEVDLEDQADQHGVDSAGNDSKLTPSHRFVPSRGSSLVLSDEEKRDTIKSKADILAETLEKYLPGNQARSSVRSIQIGGLHSRGASVRTNVNQSHLSSVSNGSFMSTTSYGAPKKEIKPYFSQAVCVVLIIFFIIEIIVNGGFEPFTENILGGPSSETLVTMGAKVNSLILEDGEWYRVFTATLLHAGVLHLFFNLLGMMNVVIPAEVEFGSKKIAFIYVLSGIYGELLSTLFVPAVGVGASGAIFGLFGACWADIIQNYSLYGSAARSTLLRLFLFTLVNAAVGLVPLIDNFAHMGGLQFGFVAGLALLVEKRYNSQGDLKPRKLYQLILQAAALLLIPILILVPFILVVNGFSGEEFCPGCIYITCIPSEYWSC